MPQIKQIHKDTKESVDIQLIRAIDIFFNFTYPEFNIKQKNC